MTKADDSVSGFWATLRHLLYLNTLARSNMADYLRTAWWIDSRAGVRTVA
jgi:hypothetical protein